MTQGWAPAPTPSPSEQQPIYKRGWFIALAAGTVGLMLGVAGASGDPEPRVVTVTSIVERTVEVPATTDEPVTTEKPTTTTEPGPETSFSDGQYRVGEDIRAGTYRSDGSSCYWARLKSFSGDLDAINANGNTSGRGIVRISPSDYGFETNGGCTWTRTSG